MWAIEQHGTIDFETYSEAGHVWDEGGQKWTAPNGSTKKGIAAVGALAYAEHPSTEVLTMSYRLPGDAVIHRWQPGKPAPQALFDALASGALFEAHNAMFERAVWHYVCRRRYGWPEFPPDQWRCSMAKARVNNLPGALGNLTDVLPVKTAKNPDGKRLLNKFSVPRKPTKKDPSTRTRMTDDPADAERLYAYCDTDVLAEDEASSLMMPMTVNELRFWQLDQRINWRGVGVDMPAVQDMIAVLEQALDQYGDECERLTGGVRPSQVAKLQGWLAAKGMRVASLDADAIADTRKIDGLPADVDRVLEIRQMVGSASVKKLYAFARSANTDNRVRNIITHHGARTGRPTGDLVQPLNMPKAGPDLVYCDDCSKPSKWPPVQCPWCLSHMSPVAKRYSWPDTPKGHNENPVDDVAAIMASQSLPVVEHFFGDALLSISGCMRGMIVAADGYDLIASDYSAIEAVVTAMLAGCQWRIDAFRERKDIYLVSCAAMGMGLTYEDYVAYADENGSHHPHRQKKGKVAELALGFGGWVGAWRQFDPDGSTDDEVKATILAWRDASPEIVEMWGGQARGKPWDANRRFERFGFEGAMVNAIQHPGKEFTSNGIAFYMRCDALIIRLLSGRELTYHSPRLWQSDRDAGLLKITYMTWNSNPKYGSYGWGPMETYGGRIAENIVQATAHDIQRFGIEALEAAGYPIVLHVYDEDVAEVPKGFGSIEQFEAIMSTMPPWAEGWPVRASGGWRGRRYRKA